MKAHFAVFLLILLGLGISAYVIVTKLHHTDIKPIFEEYAGMYRDSSDKNLNEVEVLGTRPNELFEASTFELVYPDLRWVSRVEEVLEKDPSPRLAWSMGDIDDTDGGEISLTKIVWSPKTKTAWWSGWETFYPSAVVIGDALRDITLEGTSTLPGITRSEYGKGIFLEDEDIFFGTEAFKEHFKNRRSILYPKNLPDSPEGLHTGWVLKDYDNSEILVDIARVVWTDEAYWVSDFEHLPNNSYIKDGVIWQSGNEGWEGQRSNNWPQIFGIMIGAFLFFMFIFGMWGYGYQINREDDYRI